MVYPADSGLDHRRDKVRRVPRIMKYSLLRGDKATTLFVVATLVQIPVDQREIAAGYGQGDTVSQQKSVAGKPLVDLVAVEGPRIDEPGCFQAIAESGTDDTIKNHRL